MAVHRELETTLSLHASSNDDVAKLYADRIMQLKSAPSPRDRVRAANGLYGADGIADVAVPALIEACEGDAAKEVQLASVLALGGFTKNKDGAETVLLRRLNKVTDDTERLTIIWALSELDPSSSVVRKFVRSELEAYIRTPKGSGYAQVDWLLEFLTIVPEQGAMATRNLLDAAEKAHGDSQPGDFGGFGELLIRVAPDDKRVLRFFQLKAKEEGQMAVFSDSMVKRILAMQNKKQ